MRRSRITTPLLLLAAAGFLSGCGGGGKTVSGEVSYGTVKPVPGEKWSISLAGEGDKSYSIDVGEDNKFSTPNIPEGTYRVSVTQYAPRAAGKTSAPPKTSTYPETWKVPGGPYTLDLSKLMKK